ncbi:MAG TPA: 2-oxoacid:acceptor oxidoreductase subunit alpha [Armatimonadota bacterium]|nr:2-oxoacid:acceptor oxidoreductase subunit alpha [Armatimonadota bacterium]
MTRTVKFMQGNEACAEGALAAGVRFFAGYPITPSTEIAEILSERLPQVGGKFIQMEDEIASMAAIIGASLAGSKSMTATSGPGFSLKQENLGYASYTEVPCIIVNIMRGGPSTGSPTSPSQGDVMQARWGAHGDHPIIALAPSSVREMYELTIKAVNLSEEYRVPAILLSDEIIAHMRERIEIPDQSEIELFQRRKPTLPPGEYRPYHADPETDIPPMANFGEGYRFNVTGLTHNEAGFYTSKPDEITALHQRLHRKIERNRDKIIQVEQYYSEDADLAVFAYGSTARTALRAVREAREKGIKACLIRPITMWPFPDKIIHEIAARVRAFIVPEMNIGQMVFEVERAAHGQAQVYGLPKVSWELLTPTEILEKIEEVDKWHKTSSST